jgi:hypothetical protein
VIVLIELLVLALATLPLLVALSNIRILRATAHPAPGPGIRVSILIPARNEEKHIDAALRAARASRGVPVEILVMDDGSSDRTAAIVRSHADQDGRVRLLTAPSLQEGWTGKVHACHHLSRAAGGTHLLFVDADVRLSPDAAAVLAGHAGSRGAALVSGVPRQAMETLGELLTVPIINLMLLCYLPIGLMRRSRDPEFGAACGQMLLVERASYESCGGHGAIRHLLHDGIQLARLLRRHGYRTDLIRGDDIASCRMYERFGDAWKGFAKNAHEGIATPVALPVWTILLAGGHILPFALLPVLPNGIVLLSALLSLAARTLVTVATRENAAAILLHPFTIATGLAIQWATLLRIGAGRQAGWKGRVYPVG